MWRDEIESFLRPYLASDANTALAIAAAVAIAIAIKWLLRGSASGASHRTAKAFRTIPDQYRSLEQVQEALRKEGLESCNLIIGVDYTKSNSWTGTKSFGGKCLHDIDRRFPERKNPYQQAIWAIARTLETFDDDNLIPAYGFGDARTTDKAVFSFALDRPCEGLEEVLKLYEDITPLVNLSGPTSFKPIIDQAIRIVRETGQFHVLIIIADGQVVREGETISAIEEASKYPLSIVVVGVGDGPWAQMQEFDDALPKRKFDNFQFVNFHDIVDGENPSEQQLANFAMHALMELPEQYRIIRELYLR